MPTSVSYEDEEPCDITTQLLMFGIEASTIVSMANEIKDNPKCKRVFRMFCPTCTWRHCDKCEHDSDCYCSYCPSWEICGLNEAAIFLMEVLPGMTLAQAQGVLRGTFKLEGESASSQNPEGQISLRELAEETFMDKVVCRLNDWTDKVPKE